MTTPSLPFALYTDGGVVKRNPSPIGGSWAWRQVDAQYLPVAEDSGVVRSVDMDGGMVSNNQMELAAVIEGLEHLPAGWCGTVRSDSRVTLCRVFLWSPLTNVPAEWKERLRAAKKRLGTFRVVAVAAGPMRFIQPAHTLMADSPGVYGVLLSGHPTKEQLRVGYGRGGRPVSLHNAWCDRRCTELTRRLASEG